LLGLLEVLVNGSGDAAFEGSYGLASPIALGTAPLVVGLAWAGQVQLGDGDAVQGGIQLPVAPTRRPVAVGAARADWNGCCPGVHGKAGLGAEPGHAGGLGDELGRGQRPAAGQVEQR
jgi:hypothetical protein